MPDFTESTPASRAADRAELAVLIIEIPRLEARQASIQERLAAYIYPIETIPHEIMSEIFLWYIDGGTYPSGPQFLSGDRPESLLLVCKTWRDIALATPRLWRTLKFGHGATLQRRFANPDTLLQTHVNIARRRLERSGALPIAFSVLAPEKLRGGTVGFSRASHAAILALMLEDTNPARWEYARIILERDYFGPRIEGTFHQLRVLDVVNKKGLIGSFLAPFTSDNAPKLSTLFAWIPDLAWLTGAFPWSQLTRVCIRNPIDTHMVLTILSQSTALEECRFVIKHDMQARSAPPRATPPQLQMLILETDFLGSGSASFLSRLLTPKLKCLYLDEELFVMPGFAADVPRAVAEIVPNLTGGHQLDRLCMGKASKSEDAYRSALEGVSRKFSVRRADLRYGDNDDLGSNWGSWRLCLD